MAEGDIVTKYIVIGVPEFTIHLSPELFGVYDTIDEARRATHDAIVVDHAQSAVFRPLQIEI